MCKTITYILITIINMSVALSQVTSEEFLVKNNTIELPGTLTFTKHNIPLIIWVHGSGNIDRNGNQKPIIKANYIKQFRDSITKNDIAFVSYDKRTATKKNIPYIIKNNTFRSFVEDLEKVIDYFKNDKRFTGITLIGHSQGALVAMLAAKKVDKYISIAGTAVSADKLMIKQIQQQAPFLDSITKAHFKELSETGKIANVNPMLQTIFAKQNQSFLNSWIQYTPTEEFKKLTLPILLINGTEDLQVKVEEAKVLQKANNKSKLVIIKNMNHVLKEVNSLSENKSSYIKANFPISRKLVKTVTTFVKQ